MVFGCDWFWSLREVFDRFLRIAPFPLTRWFECCVPSNTFVQVPPSLPRHLRLVAIPFLALHFDLSGVARLLLFDMLVVAVS